MFARRLRLSRQDIADVSADSTSKRASGEHFSAVCRKKDGAAGGCAVVVSRKVAKTSVARHLLKRRVREALRDWCNDSYALIVYARDGSGALATSSIIDELTTLLPRVGAYRTM